MIGKLIPQGVQLIFRKGVPWRSALSVSLLQQLLHRHCFCSLRLSFLALCRVVLASLFLASFVIDHATCSIAGILKGKASGPRRRPVHGQVERFIFDAIRTVVYHPANL